MSTTHDVAVPSEARAFQGHRAGVVTRTAANLVDSAVAVAVVASAYVAWCAVRFLLGPSSFTFPAPKLSAVFACWAVVLCLYFTASWATVGRTYGDHLLGLRVLNFRGERLRWTGAFVRAVFCVVLPIGLYWVLVGTTNRSLQDTVLRTSVLYDWTTRSLSPTRPPPTSADQ